MRQHARAATQPRRTESPDLARPQAATPATKHSTLTNARHQSTLEGRAAGHSSPPHTHDAGTGSADAASPTGFAHDFSRIPAGGTTPEESRREGAPGLEAGSPLRGGLRSSLESYFKTSLGGVKVHADPESQATAERLGASAFTLGQNIHLGPEGVRADGASRDALLAHEVVHTLQQGPVVARAKPKVGARDDAFERQADRLAAGFTRFKRNPHDPIAMKLRDSMSIRQVSGEAPAIQRGRVPTYFGEFEDFKYQDMTDAAGKEVGVEMYLKFHPGPKAVADVIGMTQAAQGTFNGVKIRQGIYGEHSASTGAGVGVFIDRLEGFPNPIYPTTEAVKPGGKAENLQDYETEPIVPLTPAEQTTRAAATGLTGQRYTGWGKTGSHKMVGGALVPEAAELYDTPVLPTAGANSEQVFETTALAISGALNRTYYGSVEWGWRKDAAGAFTRLPLRVISQGVPSVNFLTAAKIWNESKASFGFVATAATDLLDATLTKIPGAAGTIAVGAELVPTGRVATVGAITYAEVSHAGTTGAVDSSKIRPAAIGAATVDLPVPMIHTVTNPAGSTMILDTAPVATIPLPTGSTLALAAGSRVTTTHCMAPRGALTNHYKGEVVDGPQTGARGYFYVPDLTLEELGKH